MANRKLNLYLLETDDFDYDDYEGFVIRAENEELARIIASAVDERGKDEPNVWLDDTRSDCILITGEGDEEVVISSFNSD